MRSTVLAAMFLFLSAGYAGATDSTVKLDGYLEFRKGDYMIVDDPMRDALRAELASVNPDPSAFKQFSNRSRKFLEQLMFDADREAVFRGCRIRHSWPRRECIQ